MALLLELEGDSSRSRSSTSSPSRYRGSNELPPRAMPSRTRHNGPGITVPGVDDLQSATLVDEFRDWLARMGEGLTGRGETSGRRGSHSEGGARERERRSEERGQARGGGQTEGAEEERTERERAEGELAEEERERNDEDEGDQRLSSNDDEEDDDDNEGSDAVREEFQRFLTRRRDELQEIGTVWGLLEAGRLVETAEHRRLEIEDDDFGSFDPLAFFRNEAQLEVYGGMWRRRTGRMDQARGGGERRVLDGEGGRSEEMRLRNEQDGRRRGNRGYHNDNNNYNNANANISTPEGITTTTTTTTSAALAATAASSINIDIDIFNTDNNIYYNHIRSEDNQQSDEGDSVDEDDFDAYGENDDNAYNSNDNDDDDDDDGDNDDAYDDFSSGEDSSDPDENIVPSRVRWGEGWVKRKRRRPFSRGRGIDDFDDLGRIIRKEMRSRGLKRPTAMWVPDEDEGKGEEEDAGGWMGEYAWLQTLWRQFQNTPLLINDLIVTHRDRNMTEKNNPINQNHYPSIPPLNTLIASWQDDDEERGSHGKGKEVRCVCWMRLPSGRKGGEGSEWLKEEGREKWGDRKKNNKLAEEALFISTAEGRTLLIRFISGFRENEEPRNSAESMDDVSLLSSPALKGGRKKCIMDLRVEPCPLLGLTPSRGVRLEVAEGTAPLTYTDLYGSSSSGRSGSDGEGGNSNKKTKIQQDDNRCEDTRDLPHYASTISILDNFKKPSTPESAYYLEPPPPRFMVSNFRHVETGVDGVNVKEKEEGESEASPVLLSVVESMVATCMYRVVVEVDYEGPKVRETYDNNGRSEKSGESDVHFAMIAGEEAEIVDEEGEKGKTEGREKIEGREKARRSDEDRDYSLRTPIHGSSAFIVGAAALSVPLLSGIAIDRAGGRGPRQLLVNTLIPNAMSGESTTPSFLQLHPTAPITFLGRKTSDSVESFPYDLWSIPFPATSASSPSLLSNTQALVLSYGDNYRVLRLNSCGDTMEDITDELGLKMEVETIDLFTNSFLSSLKRSSNISPTLESSSAPVPLKEEEEDLFEGSKRKSILFIGVCGEDKRGRVFLAIITSQDVNIVRMNNQGNKEMSWVSEEGKRREEKGLKEGEEEEVGGEQVVRRNSSFEKMAEDNKEEGCEKRDYSSHNNYLSRSKDANPSNNKNTNDTTSANVMQVDAAENSFKAEEIMIDSDTMRSDEVVKARIGNEVEMKIVDINPLTSLPAVTTFVPLPPITGQFSSMDSDLPKCFAVTDISESDSTSDQYATQSGTSSSSSINSSNEGLGVETIKPDCRSFKNKGMDNDKEVNHNNDRLNQVTKSDEGDSSIVMTSSSDKSVKSSIYSKTTTTTRSISAISSEKIETNEGGSDDDSFVAVSGIEGIHDGVRFRGKKHASWSFIDDSLERVARREQGAATACQHINSNSSMTEKTKLGADEFLMLNTKDEMKEKEKQQAKEEVEEAGEIKALWKCADDEHIILGCCISGCIALTLSNGKIQILKPILDMFGLEEEGEEYTEGFKKFLSTSSPSNSDPLSTTSGPPVSAPPFPILSTHSLPSHLSPSITNSSPPLHLLPNLLPTRKRPRSRQVVDICSLLPLDPILLDADATCMQLLPLSETSESLQTLVASMTEWSSTVEALNPNSSSNPSLMELSTVRGSSTTLSEARILNEEVGKEDEEKKMDIEIKEGDNSFIGTQIMDEREGVMTIESIANEVSSNIDVSVDQEPSRYFQKGEKESKRVMSMAQVAPMTTPINGVIRRTLRRRRDSHHVKRSMLRSFLLIVGTRHPVQFRVFIVFKVPSSSTLSYSSQSYYPQLANLPPSTRSSTYLARELFAIPSSLFLHPIFPINNTAPSSTLATKSAPFSQMKGQSHGHVERCIPNANGEAEMSSSLSGNLSRTMEDMLVELSEEGEERLLKEEGVVEKNSKDTMNGILRKDTRQKNEKEEYKDAGKFNAAITSSTLLARQEPSWPTSVHFISTLDNVDATLNRSHTSINNVKKIIRSTSHDPSSIDSIYPLQWIVSYHCGTVALYGYGRKREDSYHASIPLLSSSSMPFTPSNTCELLWATKLNDTCIRLRSIPGSSHSFLVVGQKAWVLDVDPYNGHLRSIALDIPNVSALTCLSTLPHAAGSKVMTAPTTNDGEANLALASTKLKDKEEVRVTLTVNEMQRNVLSDKEAFQSDPKMDFSNSVMKRNMLLAAVYEDGSWGLLAIDSKSLRTVPRLYSSNFKPLFERVNSAIAKENRCTLNKDENDVHQNYQSRGSCEHALCDDKNNNDTVMHKVLSCCLSRTSLDLCNNDVNSSQVDKDNSVQTRSHDDILINQASSPQLDMTAANIMTKQRHVHWGNISEKAKKRNESWHSSTSIPKHGDTFIRLIESLDYLSPCEVTPVTFSPALSLIHPETQAFVSFTWSKKETVKTDEISLADTHNTKHKRGNKHRHPITTNTITKDWDASDRIQRHQNVVSGRSETKKEIEITIVSGDSDWSMASRFCDTYLSPVCSSSSRTSTNPFPYPTPLIQTCPLDSGDTPLFMNLWNTHGTIRGMCEQKKKDLYGVITRRQKDQVAQRHLLASTTHMRNGNTSDSAAAALWSFFPPLGNDGGNIREDASNRQMLYVPFDFRNRTTGEGTSVSTTNAITAPHRTRRDGSNENLSDFNRTRWETLGNGNGLANSNNLDLPTPILNDTAKHVCDVCCIGDCPRKRTLGSLIMIGSLISKGIDGESKQSKAWEGKRGRLTLLAIQETPVLEFLSSRLCLSLSPIAKLNLSSPISAACGLSDTLLVVALQTYLQVFELEADVLSFRPLSSIKTRNRVISMSVVPDKQWLAATDGLQGVHLYKYCISPSNEVLLECARWVRENNVPRSLCFVINIAIVNLPSQSMLDTEVGAKHNNVPLICLLDAKGTLVVMANSNITNKSVSSNNNLTEIETIDLGHHISHVLPLSSTVINSSCPSEAKVTMDSQASIVTNNSSRMALLCEDGGLLSLRLFKPEDVTALIILADAIENDPISKPVSGSRRRSISKAKITNNGRSLLFDLDILTVFLELPIQDQWRLSQTISQKTSRIELVLLIQKALSLLNFDP